MTDKERLIELMQKCDIVQIPTSKFIEGFADYLLEHGVIVLPCKVGDILCCESAIKGHITYLEAPNLEWIVENKELFGKEIFFSGEEAEKALKERER